MLGTGLLAGGIALAALPPLGAVVGLAASLLGADIIARAVRDRGLFGWRSHRRVASEGKAGDMRASA